VKLAGDTCLIYLPYTCLTYLPDTCLTYLPDPRVNEAINQIAQNHDNEELKGHITTGEEQWVAGFEKCMVIEVPLQSAERSWRSKPIGWEKMQCGLRRALCRTWIPSNVATKLFHNSSYS
jgi:hypothetical protein